MQLLCKSRAISPSLAQQLAVMARAETSSFVRLGLASAMQRLPTTERWEVAAGLVSHETDAADQNLTLMIWYGIEPLVPKDRARATRLIGQCKIPLVRQFIARRMAGQ